jgi:hypothetical protein
MSSIIITRVITTVRNDAYSRSHAHVKFMNSHGNICIRYNEKFLHPSVYFFCMFTTYKMTRMFNPLHGTANWLTISVDLFVTVSHCHISTQKSLVRLPGILDNFIKRDELISWQTSVFGIGSLIFISIVSTNSLLHRVCNQIDYDYNNWGYWKLNAALSHAKDILTLLQPTKMLS